MGKRLTDVIGWCERDGKTENLYSIAGLIVECTRESEEKYQNALGSHDYIGRKKAEASVINKLGQHEDIEEEFGIDLATLHKALKDGIWYRLQNGEFRYIQVALVRAPEGWILVEFYPKPTNVAIQLYNPMHKYGVVWALTKGELK